MTELLHFPNVFYFINAVGYECTRGKSLSILTEA